MNGSLFSRRLDVLFYRLNLLIPHIDVNVNRFFAYVSCYLRPLPLLYE